MPIRHFTKSYKSKVAPVAKKAVPKVSQRDSYAKAMYGATKRGGSNGIGVGY